MNANGCFGKTHGCLSHLALPCLFTVSTSPPGKQSHASLGFTHKQLIQASWSVTYTIACLGLTRNAIDRHEICDRYALPPSMHVTLSGFVLRALS